MASDGLIPLPQGTNTTVNNATKFRTQRQPISHSPWRDVIARYQRPDARRALFQVTTTLLLLVAAQVVMYRALAWAPWLTILLVIPTAGLFVRTFVIMHDCAHGSFLPWPWLNDAVGFVTGVLTLTPFGQWRRDHALHHASSGDLDRRGHGDVATLTVREYLALSRFGRFRYRLFRHPAFFLGLGPFDFIVGQRFRLSNIGAGSRQFASVWGTNAAIALVGAALAMTVNFWLFLLIFIPTYYLAAAVGIWLFFLQHQFDEAYWERHEHWDYATAAIAGSSYFRLPAVLQWFTGNIGLHHVHHLGPRIPNYRLQRCHDENPLFHEAPVITLARSMQLLRLALWDEDRQRLVRFAEAHAPAQKRMLF